MNSFDEKLLKIVSVMTSAGGSSGSSSSGSSGSSSSDSTGDSTGDSTVVGNNPFKGKWVSILGDDASAYTGWTTLTSNASSKSFTAQSMWWHKLLTKLGAKLCVNYSDKGIVCTSLISDSSICLHREIGKNYKNLDGTVETSTEEVNPDVILIFLGMTDYYNNAMFGEYTFYHIGIETSTYENTTLIQCYDTVVYRIRQKYPNASIFCISPPIVNGDNQTTVSTYPYLNKTGWSIPLLSFIIHELSFKQCFKDIPLSRSMRDTITITDAVPQLSEQQHQLIATTCYQAMINDSVSQNT